MTVIDPVCCMSFEEKDAAATTVYEGRTYIFCSPSCKTKFDQNPQAFLGTKAAPVSESLQRTEGRLYTCPMHPEIAGAARHPPDMRYGLGAANGR